LPLPAVLNKKKDLPSGVPKTFCARAALAQKILNSNIEIQNKPQIKNGARPSLAQNLAQNFWFNLCRLKF